MDGGPIQRYICFTCYALCKWAHFISMETVYLAINIKTPLGIILAWGSSIVNRGWSTERKLLFWITRAMYGMTISWWTMLEDIATQVNARGFMCTSIQYVSANNCQISVHGNAYLHFKDDIKYKNELIKRQVLLWKERFCYYCVIIWAWNIFRLYCIYQWPQS